MELLAEDRDNLIATIRVYSAEARSSDAPTQWLWVGQRVDMSMVVKRYGNCWREHTSQNRESNNLKAEDKDGGAMKHFVEDDRWLSPVSKRWIPIISFPALGLYDSTSERFKSWIDASRRIDATSRDPSRTTRLMLTF